MASRHAKSACRSGQRMVAGGSLASLRFRPGSSLPLDRIAPTTARFLRDQADLKRRSGRDLDAAELASLTEPS